MTAPHELADAVGGRLAHFPAATSGGDELVFEYRLTESVAVPSAGRRVYESTLGDVRYQEDGRLTIACGESVVLDCDPVAGHVEVSLLESELRNLWLLSRPLFTLPLMELLKHRGRYPLHAATVALDGRGILLAGSTGSGKSTLAVAFVRAGFDFLGDDLVFLSPGDGGMRALGFADEIDLTADSIRLFPDLGELAGSLEQGWPKRRIPPAALGATVVAECTPTAVVLPRVTGAEGSTLAPVDSSEALLELVPNVLLTERESSQGHLDALGRLVKETACYRLEVGLDLGELPGLFDDV